MEASQDRGRNQLPLDAGPDATPDGVVRALDDRLVIEGLTVSDERAARVVRERAEAGRPPQRTVANAIEIGARVLDAEETAVNVDYVRRELTAALGEAGRKLDDTVEQGTTDIAEQIAAAFGPERADSVQAQIKEILATTTRQQHDALFERLTAEDGTNPLVAMQARIGVKVLEAEERHRAEVERVREAHAKAERAMSTKVDGLQKQLAQVLERRDADERVAEAEDAGTRKGLGFEERVHHAVERIASVRGDAATHTGSEQAEGGGKKGDTLVELGRVRGTGARTGPVRGEGREAVAEQGVGQLNDGMAGARRVIRRHGGRG